MIGHGLASDKLYCLRQEKPRRKPTKAPVGQPITQEQMLLEAAFTEIHNTRSLAQLLAREEAVKARTAEKAGPYTGPVIRFRSRRKDDVEQVSCWPDTIAPAEFEAGHQLLELPVPSVIPRHVSYPPQRALNDIKRNAHVWVRSDA